MTTKHEIVTKYSIGTIDEMKTKLSEVLKEEETDKFIEKYAVFRGSLEECVKFLERERADVESKLLKKEKGSPKFLKLEEEIRNIDNRIELFKKGIY